jgi:MFS family permease
MAMGYIPVAISFVKQILPPKMVNPAMAAISATLGVGGALGLPLAAWIAQSHDWHMLFWVAAGLAAIVLVLSATMLPMIRSTQTGRLDFTGAIVLALGLVSVLVAVTKGSTWGWTSLTTLGLAAGGVIVLILWGILQLRTAEPLVDLRTTASRPVLMTNLAAILIGFGMMANSIVVPQLLQLPVETGVGLGQTMLQAGLWMAPGGLMMMALSPVSSMILSRFGGKTAFYTCFLIGAGAALCGALLACAIPKAPKTVEASKAPQKDKAA